MLLSFTSPETTELKQEGLHFYQRVTAMETALHRTYSFVLATWVYRVERLSIPPFSCFSGTRSNHTLTSSFASSLWTVTLILALVHSYGPQSNKHNMTSPSVTQPSSHWNLLGNADSLALTPPPQPTSGFRRWGPAI